MHTVCISGSPSLTYALASGNSRENQGYRLEEFNFQELPLILRFTSAHFHICVLFCLMTPDVLC